MCCTYPSVCRSLFERHKCFQKPRSSFLNLRFISSHVCAPPSSGLCLVTKGPQDLGGKVSKDWTLTPSQLRVNYRGLMWLSGSRARLTSGLWLPQKSHGIVGPWGHWELLALGSEEMQGGTLVPEGLSFLRSAKGRRRVTLLSLCSFFFFFLGGGL